MREPGLDASNQSVFLHEVIGNLPRLTSSATIDWNDLRAKLNVVPDIVSFPWMAVFAAAKDRPILFTASAWSDVLLTLDRRDFVGLLGTEFYGLPILKPGDFLARQREALRLK